MASEKTILKSPKHRKRRVWLYILGIIAVVIILVHIFLPRILLNHINKSLAQIKGYYGHVDDVDLHIYRGAYQIKGLKLENTSGEVPVPFIDMPKIDIQIEWRQIFRGKVVARLKFVNPKINFVKGPTKAQSQTKADTSWKDVVDKWVPVKINRLEVQNGEIHYRDFNSNPKIDLMMSEINAVAKNLTNKKQSGDTLLPSSVEVAAKVYDEGSFQLKMKLDALADNPTFDLNAQLTNLNLVRLNDFFKAYAKIDVEKGNFDVFTEVAADSGTYKGYVKPLVKDIKIVALQKDTEKPLKLFWESIVASIATVFTNPSEGQIATKIPFSGSVGKGHVDIWTTIGTLLRNAFIQALNPSIDNSIHIGETQTNP